MAVVNARRIPKQPVRGLMSAPDWTALPALLRDAIREHCRPGNDTAPEYTAALAAAMGHLRKLHLEAEAAATRAAELAALQETLW